MKSMSFKQHFYRLVNAVLSRPQEIQAFLISSWLLRFGSRPLPLNQKSAIVFSPHQDDETLGCGGMIALKRQCNVPVRVVFLTDGQKSHMYAPWLESPPNIVEIRQQEAISALSLLGVTPSDIHFLDQVDGSLRDLSFEQRQSLIQQLAQLLLHYQPEEIYIPHRKDKHCDHESTYQLVQAAIAHTHLQSEVLQYPIWLFWESLLFFDIKLKDLAHAVRLATKSVQDQKKQAILAYQSQHPLLPPGFLRSYLTPYEIFFKE
jgi:LmbE family N-acetylglucosaminyl deacetylase